MKNQLNDVLSNMLYLEPRLNEKSCYKEFMRQKKQLDKLLKNNIVIDMNSSNDFENWHVESIRWEV